MPQAMYKTYAEMKDSGVEWIGEIPEEWDRPRKLKYVVKCLDGKRIPVDAEQRESGPYPYWGAGAIMDYVDKYIFDEELVLLGEDGAPFFDPIRNVAHHVNGKIWVNNHIHVLKPKLNVDASFLTYYLNIVDYRSYINGSILSKLTQNNMTKIMIMCPPLPEQTAIAEYLDDKCAAIDEIIAEAKATIEEYKAWKASVIFEAVTKGLDPSVEMKDSGVEWIGKIPKGWSVVPLKRFYDHSNGAAVRVGPFGSALAGSDITTEGVWVYNQRTVLDNNFETNNTFVTPAKAKDLAGFGVFSGDILITTRGSIGKIVIVPENAPYGVLHPCIIRFRVDERKINKRLLQYIFNDTALIKQQILYHSNSTTIDVLYSYTLKELVLPLIPRHIQDEIIFYLDKKIVSIDAIISEKEALIADMESYKKSLIFETVTGKRKVV